MVLTGCLSSSLLLTSLKMLPTLVDWVPSDWVPSDFCMYNLYEYFRAATVKKSESVFLNHLLYHFSILLRSMGALRYKVKRRF